MNVRILSLATLGLLAVAGLACDNGDTTASNGGSGGAQTATPAVANADPLPPSLVVDAAPAGAKTVNEVRAEAKEGDEVVVRGVVAGRADPIADNRATFTLLDPSVRTCNQVQGDACETPWDACCEPADEIAKQVANVQVAGPDGKPLKAALAGVGGLAPLKQVTVVGTFRPSPDGKAATIDAKSIHVAQ